MTQTQPKHRPNSDLQKFADQDQTFRAACEKAGILPTARQAGKWSRKTGLAWKVSHHG